MTRRGRLLTWSAGGAAVLAALSAAVSASWMAGGTWLLSTVGGALEEQGRRGGAVATAGLALVVALKLAAAVLALALLHPPRSRPLRRPLVPAALLGGGLLTLYGGVLVVVGAVGLTRALGEPADPVALRWHVLFWDPWFLSWGLLLLTAALARRRADARDRAGSASAGPAPSG
ncbi:DUF3995 domain-containing protein [Geodermatophilus sp. URMC 63]